MTNARTAKTTREKAAEMRAEAQRQEARRRTVLVTAAVAAVIAVIVAAVVIVKVASGQSGAATAASTPANLSDGGILVGSPTAKVTIEMYEDFQCPACKQFEDANATQMAAWAKDGTVKLVYRPVAILDRVSTTEYSTRSLNAAAAVVTADPTKFAAFHSLLFANQQPEGSAGLSDTQLIDYAVQAGVAKSAVESAITTQKYRPWTVQQTDDFSKKGFTGTPTIVVNGTQVKSFDPAALKAAVDAAAK